MILLTKLDSSGEARLRSRTVMLTVSGPEKKLAYKYLLVQGLGTLLIKLESFNELSSHIWSGTNSVRT